MLWEGRGMGNLRLVIPGIPGNPGNHIKSKVKFKILLVPEASEASEGDFVFLCEV